MLNKLIVQHGFERAVQYTGYVILAALVIACALMHPRFVPASMRPAGADAKKPSPKQLFSKKPYALLVAGLFCVAWGLFFPIYYLQVSHTLCCLSCSKKKDTDDRSLPKTTASPRTSSSTPSPSSMPRQSLAESAQISWPTTLGR